MQAEVGQVSHGGLQRAEEGSEEREKIGRFSQYSSGGTRKSGLPIKLDDLVVKDFKLVKSCRIYVGMANKNKLLEFIQNDCQPILDEGTPLKFYININAGIRYTRENDKPSNILSVLRGFGTTEKTKTYLKNMGIYYDYPKPVALIEYLIKVGCGGGGIVMDFFAGSGTTAEAVINLNANDDAQRQFICVQLPDPPTGLEASINGKPANLAEITEYRIRTVANKVHKDSPMFSGDLGFRVFALQSSNFKAWKADKPKDAEQLAKQLTLHVDHLVEGRTQLDVLYELLLKSGFSLDTRISVVKLAGSSVYSVAEGAMLICLENNLTTELIKAIADKRPQRVVCLDQGFAGNDQLKTNAVQTMKTKGVVSFRTV